MNTQMTFSLSPCLLVNLALFTTYVGEGEYDNPGGRLDVEPKSEEVEVDLGTRSVFA